MNLVGLLVQAFLDRQAREQTERLREAGVRAAEKGRRLALAGVCWMAALGLLFAALLFFATELGLQSDRATGWSYGGFFVSATLLAVLAGVAAVIGAIIAAGESNSERPNPPPPPPRSTELRDLLEEIAVQFLKQFAQSLRSENKTTEPRETERRS